MSEVAFVHQLIRASAGSGKTHQLTNRYLDLIAAGIEPDSILATTFTRKAAGEISNRVLARLASAASSTAGAKQLAAQLRVEKNRQDFVALLRQLLHNLHRMRIGTLDSFYISLASSFSLELGLPAGWSICEEADEKVLQLEALEGLLEQQPDDVGTLLPLLTRGTYKRSIHGELERVIDGHYEIYLGSQRAAWESLRLPKPVAEAARQAALDQLRNLDLSNCGNKHFSNAHVKDLASFDDEDWLAFVSRGLAGKVLAGETTYQRKPITPAMQTIYQTLLQHARYEILQMIAVQTRATYDLLDRYHAELWARKRITGQLRFGEVTQTLVDSLGEQAFSPAALAFRLNGAIDHLLLDEFQDTSLAQWRVLQPMASGITHAKPASKCSFFCVGDAKQAIYGWRGGMVEILNTLPESLGQLQEHPLVESRRSAQPVIDVVNKVFGNLAHVDLSDKMRPALTAWSQRFTPHTTFKKELPGYVRLQAGPAQQEEQSSDEHRGAHCGWVAERIREIVQDAPGSTVGVLCRSNKIVSRMIFELRHLRVEASEEGGNQLTDSAAVSLILSLLTLTDHPGHSIAWFHLQNSPLRDHLVAFPNAEALSRQLRRQLLAEGYGRFLQSWAERIAPACDRRELSRLQQLVEMAYDFEPSSTLRADDFVARVRDQRVPDPSGANVRVMTIHSAKGLEFDVVILPQLDSRFAGMTPSYVAGRDPKSLDVNFVCRYAEESVRQLMTSEEQAAFELDRQQGVEESLSLLYVAMTRAIHGLFLFMPAPRQRSDGEVWHKLLTKTLAPDSEVIPGQMLFEHGDAKWFRRLAPPAPTAVARPDKPIVFRKDQSPRRRGLEHVAPSRREGQARVALDRLFNPSIGTGTAAGTLYHAWFSTIGWLDDRSPTDTELRAVAEKMRATLPAETWTNLNQMLAEFRKWLENPAVGNVLQRSAYQNPLQPGFPKTLAPFWTEKMGPPQVEQERRFLIHDGTKFWNGSFDRVVWFSEGERAVAAEVIDYKTDAIRPGDEAALVTRVEHYRPQLAAYRQAIGLLANLPPERVAARLVFTIAGRVVDV